MNERPWVAPHLELLSAASRNVRQDLMGWNPIERTWFANQPLRIDRILFVVKRAFHETFKRRARGANP